MMLFNLNFTTFYNYKDWLMEEAKASFNKLMQQRSKLKQRKILRSLLIKITPKITNKK